MHTVQSEFILEIESTAATPEQVKAARAFPLLVEVRRQSRRLAGIYARTASNATVVRVFGFERRTQRLLDDLGQRWRYLGPIRLIGGTYLAHVTIGWGGRRGSHPRWGDCVRIGPGSPPPRRWRGGRRRPFGAVVWPGARRRPFGAVVWPGARRSRSGGPFVSPWVARAGQAARHRCDRVRGHGPRPQGRAWATAAQVG
jgi:hypothetical protein